MVDSLLASARRSLGAMRFRVESTILPRTVRAEAHSFLEGHRRRENVARFHPAYIYARSVIPGYLPYNVSDKGSDQCGKR